MGPGQASGRGACLGLSAKVAKPPPSHWAPGWLAPVIIIPILLAVSLIISEKVYRNWRHE